MCLRHTARHTPKCPKSSRIAKFALRIGMQCAIIAIRLPTCVLVRLSTRHAAGRKPENTFRFKSPLTESWGFLAQKMENLKNDFSQFDFVSKIFLLLFSAHHNNCNNQHSKKACGDNCHDSIIVQFYLHVLGYSTPLPYSIFIENEGNYIVDSLRGINGLSRSFWTNY